MHAECYQRYVQRNIDYTRPRRITTELQVLTKEEKEFKEKVRHEMAKSCPHCKSAIPVLWDLNRAEIAELKRSSIATTGFAKAANIIRN